MSRVSITPIQASGILTPQKADSSISFMDYSLNPYVGCAFGCTYCYVREMQFGDDADEKSSEWGNWVKVKENALQLLQRSLKRLYGKRIMVGSATDPYQPIERRLGLTRSLLEALVMAYPAKVHIQTRSPLVTRDIDVFQRFGEALSVGISLPTDDDAVRKAFEPSAPSIAQRVAAMEELHRAGVYTVAFLAPLLPCDTERLGRLIKGRCTGYLLDGMRYHKTDREMIARYRENGWAEWLSFDKEKVRETLARIWDE